MNSSAIRSSSPVVMPGSSCSPTCAIVSATTRPAAAIFSISCADLRMIMRRRPRIERALDLGEDLVDGAAGVQRHELSRRRGSARRPARSARGRSRAGARSTPACRRSGPPRARGRAPAPSPSRRRGRRRRSRRARGRSREHRVERLGLREVAREAVEDEPVARVVLREPLADHPDRELVRDEVAAGHDRVDLAAERRRVVERAEHVARRDVRDPVLGRDPLRLRALARPLRAEEQEVHYFRKPS